jgi:hypothetical protein
MAEMSFGPKVFRSPVQPRNTEEDNSFLGLGQHLAFLQGCVATRPGAPADMPIVVDFPDRPSKMLAAMLPDYGSASLLKVSLVDLPKLPMGKLRSSEVVVEVHACSVNPTDWKQRKGTLSKLCAISLPAVLGIDFSGWCSQLQPPYALLSPPSNFRLCPLPLPVSQTRCKAAACLLALPCK